MFIVISFRRGGGGRGGGGVTSFFVLLLIITRVGGWVGLFAHLDESSSILLRWVKVTQLTSWGKEFDRNLLLILRKNSKLPYGTSLILFKMSLAFWQTGTWKFHVPYNPTWVLLMFVQFLNHEGSTFVVTLSFSADFGDEMVWVAKHLVAFLATHSIFSCRTTASTLFGWKLHHKWKKWIFQHEFRWFTYLFYHKFPLFVAWMILDILNSRSCT